MTAAILSAGSAFADDKAACCAKHASNDSKAMCADFASLNVNADQKAKLETWQADCMKAGCTKGSRQAFLNKAQGILSKDQYAKLKSECAKTAKKA